MKHNELDYWKYETSCLSQKQRCKCDKSFYVITHYKHNHSAFYNPKYAKKGSAYSEIECTNCGHHFRTKAKWVDDCKFKTPTGCDYDY